MKFFSGFRVSCQAIAATAMAVVLAVAPLRAEDVSVDSKAATDRVPAEQPAAAAKDEAPPPAQGPESPPAAPSAPISRGVLPSEPKIVGDEIAAPHEILDDYELTEERFAELVDGRPMLDDERELLLRLLFRTANLPVINLEHWARQPDDLSKLLKDPAPHRRDAYYVPGRVVMVEKVSLTEQEAVRFEFAEFYRCHLFVGNPELPAVLYTRDIPDSWTPGEPMDDRISFYGLFVKRGVGSVGVAPLVFAAPRLAWHGDTLLGDLGMDTGLFDSVHHGRPMKGEERECFYQMLGTVQQAGTNELLRHAHNDVVYRARTWLAEKKEAETRRQQLKQRIRSLSGAEAAAANTELAALTNRLMLLEQRIEHAKKNGAHLFIPLLEDAESHVGQLRMFRGTAHRALKVRVTDPDLIRRYGIKHYFQIDSMVILEHTLKMVKPSKPSSPGETAELEIERVTRTHPATFCVLRLPEGMPTGDKIHEDIRIIGFFFKNWGFQSGEEGDDGLKWRLAPMLIGREPMWDEGPPPTLNVYAGAIAGGLFVLALTGIWIGVWRLNRSDQKFHKSVVAKTYSIEEGTSLNDIGLDVDGKIDFSYLASEDVRAPAATVAGDASGKESAQKASDEAANVSGS